MQLLSNFRLPKTDLSNRPTRTQIFIWLILLTSAILIFLKVQGLYQLGLHFDDARYVILARSLLHSDKYGMIYLPGEPGEAWYPFGYPLLMTPFVVLFPDNPNTIKALSIVATLLNASLLFWGWKWLSRRSYWWGLAIAGLFLFLPLTVDLSRRVMSEPVFLTFCLLGIILTEQAARKKDKKWWPILMGVVLTFVAFTRVVGFILVFVIFGYLLIIRGLRIWKQLVLVLGVMIIVVGLVFAFTSVQSIDGLIPSQYLRGSQASFVNAILDRFTPMDLSERVDSYFIQEDTNNDSRVDAELLAKSFLTEAMIWHLRDHVRQTIIPLGGGLGLRERAFAERIGLAFLPDLIGFLVSGTIILGFVWWTFTEGISSFILFAICYLVILMVWSWDDPRLLYPIQPQLQIGFLLGGEAILLATASFIGNYYKEIKYKYIIGILAIVIITLMSLSAYKSLGLKDSQKHVGDISMRTNWIKTNTTPDDVIMSEAPPIDYLYSHRKVIWPLEDESITSPQMLHSYVTKNDIDYILIAPEISWQEPVYVPFFSDSMKHLSRLVSELIKEEKFSLVYLSGDNLIKVVRVNSSEEKT